MAPEIETLENKKQQEEDVEVKEQEEVSEASAKRGKKGESSPVMPTARPTRERKTVERFMETMSRSLTPKVFTIEKGSGTQLKEIPNGFTIPTNYSMKCLNELEATCPLVEKAAWVYATRIDMEVRLPTIYGIIDILKTPEKFIQLGIDQPKGVLCYGPPGTGKTLLARAIANRTDACFIRVIGNELVQKYVGEGARMVRELSSDGAAALVLVSGEKVLKLGSLIAKVSKYADAE